MARPDVGTVFGLDAQGRTRLLIDYEASVDQVVDDIRALLTAALQPRVTPTAHSRPG